MFSFFFPFCFSETFSPKRCQKSLEKKADFIYAPVDISANIISHLKETIHKVLPSLKIVPIQGDYFHTDFLDHDPSSRKILLFLGSNIGNLSNEEANDFLDNIARNLDKGETLLRPEKILGLHSNFGIFSIPTRGQHPAFEGQKRETKQNDHTAHQ